MEGGFYVFHLLPVGVASIISLSSLLIVSCIICMFPHTGL